VEVFQREFCATRPTQRVVPLLETIHALQGATKMMETLFSNPWYRQHLKVRFLCVTNVSIRKQYFRIPLAMFKKSWLDIVTLERMVAD
jgi:hypothetical protein